MEDSTADIIVIGGGVMGCAAAYQLAKDRQRVLLLEQFAIGNRNGSSHGWRSEERRVGKECRL